MLSGTDDGTTVYVYDPKPLRRLSDGSRLFLEISFADRIMTSTATRRNHRIGQLNPDEYCVMLNGKPIGFTVFAGTHFKKLWKKGVLVKLKAKINGTVPGYRGIPNVVLQVPEYSIATRHVQTKLAFPWYEPGMKSMSFWVAEDDWDDESILNKRTNCSLRMIPTPEGSSAKPRVGFFKNEHQLFSVGARLSSYAELADMAGIECTVKAMKKVSSKGSGYYYSVLLCERK